MDVMEWKIEENGTNASTWVQFFFLRIIFIFAVSRMKHFTKNGKSVCDAQYP